MHQINTRNQPERQTTTINKTTIAQKNQRKTKLKPNNTTQQYKHTGKKTKHNAKFNKL